MKRPVRIDGRTFQVTSDDVYLANMPADFEPDMVALFKTLVGPGSVVADIGANIGLTALLFSTLAARVHAFEPVPTTFALLEANLAEAAAANVEARNIGIGSAPGEMTVTFAASDRSGGFVSRSIRPGAGYVTETVRIETLDAVFGGGEPGPDFLKIDVEGFEPEVLRGAAGLLARRRPTVVLELNHFCLNVLQRVALPDFIDQLRATFPVLIAADQGNRAFADLHDPDTAYAVMHAHVTRFAFPNVVGSFDPGVAARLEALRQRPA